MNNKVIEFPIPSPCHVSWPTNGSLALAPDFAYRENGARVSYEHNAAGRVIQQVNPDGSAREFIRNEHGDVVKEKIPGVSLRPPIQQFST